MIVLLLLYKTATGCPTNYDGTELSNEVLNVTTYEAIFYYSRPSIKGNQNATREKMHNFVIRICCFQVGKKRENSPACTG